MTDPYVADSDFTLYLGDVRQVLAQLPAESVHCVVTSPPYWGLRDYGTGVWNGGDPGCDHVRTTHRQQNEERPRGWDGSFRNTGEPIPVAYGDECGKCGARRVDQQLGLEPIPDLYVQNMVGVFREVRRVLRRDGTCWLNIGDSYAGTGPQRRNEGNTDWGATGDQAVATAMHGRDRLDPIRLGLKSKDLVGIPWRLAFALQADGWYLRADVIWAKPNPMPESVTDRPTKAHEYLFLLTRSPRYFYDADAIREPAEYGYRNHSEGWRSGVQNGDGHRSGGGSVTGGNPSAGRNRRSVWEIPTEPYPDAHFATFPQALVEPCVKAGCPEGGTVLDPFMGSGTTALVARRLGRKSIGIELNPEYARLCAHRLRQLSLLA